MIIQAEILEPPVTIDGVTYPVAGKLTPHIEYTGEIVYLKRNNKIRVYGDYDVERDSPENFKVVIYRGTEQSFFWPGESFLERGLPVKMRADDVDRLCGNHPNVEIIDTGDAIYLDHRVPVRDFKSEILPRLTADAMLRPMPKRILFMRDMGAGDIMMAVPAVRAIRQMLPLANITFATLPKFMDLLDGVESINDVVSLHDVAIDDRWDLIVNWCRSIEGYNVPRNRGPRIQSYGKMIGIDLAPEDCKLELHLTADCRRRAWDVLDDPVGIKIAYVIQANAWNRTWPIWNLGELADCFAAELPTAKLVLIDANAVSGAGVGGDYPNVVNLCGKTGSFREAAAVLECCDAAIVPDSGLAHAAGALAVPTLVLAAGIPPEARYSFFPGHRCITAEGRVDCYPCWDWQERWTYGERLEDRTRGIHRSCLQERRAKCMESITPDMIVDGMADMLAGAE